MTIAVDWDVKPNKNVQAFGSPVVVSGLQPIEALLQQALMAGHEGVVFATTGHQQTWC